jgi:hypothetical protein
MCRTLDRACEEATLSHYPTLFRIEATAAVATALLGVVTLLWRDWIEVTTGWDPDQHDGSLEWAIVAVLLLVSLSLALLARRHLRLALAR